MVEGPNDVSICVACIRVASKIADDIEQSADVTTMTPPRAT